MNGEPTLPGSGRGAFAPGEALRPWPRAANWIRARVANEAPRLHDVLLVSFTALAALYLLFDGLWVPGAWRSIALMGTIAVGLPLMRAGSRRWPKVRTFDLLASLWVLPAAGLAHSAMQALVDAAHPALLDRALARADLILFGRFPGAIMNGWVPSWGMDAFLLCYYSYYVWPCALGLWMFFRKKGPPLEHYVLALSLAYLINFGFYMLVPAIGPRFFLIGAFGHPLHGAWLTPYLDALMRQPPFMRDCFPSGHTAVTVVVLTFAFRYARRFFWVMLPIGLGLIAATIVGRFHYGIDVVCAIPMAIAVIALADQLSNRPHARVQSP